jgi:hypothetical protein
VIVPIVTYYRSLGWATIRVQPLAKAPVGAWQDRTDEPADFRTGDNVGVRLGAPSGDLVDVDLDCPEAVALAGMYLPATATFGRAGMRRHWLYRCAVVTRKPPRTHVELRSTGTQTVFPGSVHETGQPIEWLDFPATGVRALGAEELLACFGRLCAATVLARWWGSGESRGNRHDAALALAGALWHSGWTEDAARDLLLPAMELDGSSEPHREQAIRDTWGSEREGIYGWPTVERLMGVEAGAFQRGVELVPVERPAVVGGEPEGERPEVDIGADQADLLSALGAALVQGVGRHGLYRQGAALVTVDGPATAARVAVEVCKGARLVRQTQKSRVPAPCTAELAAKVAADPPALPQLRGRRAGPLVRADGSVWEAPGYDPVTEMWCDGWADPRVVALDQAGARAAAGRLWEFVWADQWEDAGVDAVSWLAHVLTVAARPGVVGPVPAWVYSAGAPGSGKTALARVAGIIGGRCGAYTQPSLRDDEELARRLDLFGLESAVVLDNLRGTLRSELLEGAVTGGELAVRRLYVGPVRVPWRCVLSVTSNGAEIGADWARRTLPVRLTGRRLDARRDVIDEAERGRMDLTADACGIVAGWLRSGLVYEGEGITGFPAWSRTVAGALKWAVGVDVAQVTRDASADMVSVEEDGASLLDLVAGWLGDRKEFRAVDLLDAPSMHALRAEYGDVGTLGRRLSRCADVTRVFRRRKSHGHVFWRIENR